MLLDEPYNIPVISVAALSGPRIGADGLMLPEEKEITLDKMRTIFQIGIMQGHDSLVLSAMGCGIILRGICYRSRGSLHRETKCRYKNFHQLQELMEVRE